jgi:hypothetical protein
MPFWLSVILNVVTVIIILGGALNFPYVPMLFGLYDGAKYILHGKFIARLIWLFPIVAIYSVYVSSTSNTFVALVPYAYLSILWIIRPNKKKSAEPASEHKTRSNNLEARLKEIEYRSSSWQNYKNDNIYYLLTFLAPDHESSGKLRKILAGGENLYSDIETSPYSNKAESVYVRIRINSVDKSCLTDITRRMVEIAWDNGCELSSIDVLEIE